MANKEELIQKNLQKGGMKQDNNNSCTTTCSVNISGINCKNPVLECPDLKQGDKSGKFKYNAEIKGFEGKVKATITVKVGEEKLGENSQTHTTPSGFLDYFTTICGVNIFGRCELTVDFNRELEGGDKVDASITFSAA